MVHGWAQELQAHVKSSTSFVSDRLSYLRNVVECAALLVCYRAVLTLLSHLRSGTMLAQATPQALPVSLLLS
eukprot:2867298-Pleurochrysis_carterae.AAC.1